MNILALPRFGESILAWVKKHRSEALILAYLCLIPCFAVAGYDHVAALMLFLFSIATMVMFVIVAWDDIRAWDEGGLIALIFFLVVGGIVCFFSHWIVTAPWIHYAHVSLLWVLDATLEAARWTGIHAVLFVRHGILG